MRNNQTGFIEQIVDGFLKENRVDYSGICLVLPTRRSVLYAKEFIAKKSKGSIILPKIWSFETLVNSVVKLEILSSDEALMYLHTVFSDIGKKYDFSFSDFLDFSMLLLKDFDQMDQNLAKPKEIYRILSASESLERWASELDSDEAITFDQSGMMSGYFTFWQICEEVYFNLRNLLISSGRAYQGLSYRLFVEDFENLISEHEFEELHFAGFNYLTGAQLKILDLLKGSFTTYFHWDIDRYFLNRKYHEAGRYLRAYGTFGEINGSEYISLQSFPDINIKSCPNKTSQVKKVIDDILDILSSLDFETEIKSRKDLIALIPADESLLRVILESFPESFRDKSGNEIEIAPILNISMGRGLQESQFTSLIHLLLDVQEIIQTRPDHLPYRNIRSIFMHPLIKAALSTQHEIDALDTDARANNQSYYKAEEIRLNAADQDLIELVFRNWSFDLTYFIDVIDYLLEKGQVISEDEKIFLSYYRNVFQRLEPLFKQVSGDIELKEYRKLLIQLIRQYSVPFSGEPISPIQVMGLLETRSLDFEHTFIISCNEGELPSKRTQDSLFPFEIKKQFGLPTFLDKDASLAYTFYRLFYRSSGMHLYYHNASEGMGGKASPSRFIRQLELELLPDFDRSFKLDTIIHNYPKNSGLQRSIGKNEVIQEKVELYLKGEDEEGNLRFGLSPSMINTYLRNPIEFFQKAIIGIREADELEEGLAASTFGSIIHEVLESIFTPYLDKKVDEITVKKIIKDINLKNELIKKTKEIAGNIQISEGINRLYLHSAEILIHNYLNLLKTDPFYLIKLETPLRHQFKFYHKDLAKEITVTIAGKADRIDLKDDVVRIVDYKTGGISKNYIKMRSFDQLWNEEERDKLLQLLIYKYLFIKNRDALFPQYGNMKVEPGFYFFRKSNRPFMKLLMEQELDDAEFCDNVESLIEQIVSHMLNHSIAFESQIEEDILGSA